MYKMQKVIYLYWKNICLLSLGYNSNNNTYIQHLNLENIKTASLRGCPVEIMLAGKRKPVIVTRYLPILFDEFNFSNARYDLIEFYRISKDDSIFDRLYKVALKSDAISHKDFWISIQ